MKRALHWILDHAYLILIAIIAVLTFVLVRRRPGDPSPLADVTREVDAIKQAASVRAVIAEHGAAAAIAKIETEHAEALKNLDIEEAATVARLKEDPVALSKFLVRAGRVR